MVIIFFNKTTKERALVAIHYTCIHLLKRPQYSYMQYIDMYIFVACVVPLFHHLGETLSRFLSAWFSLPVIPDLKKEKKSYNNSDCFVSLSCSSRGIRKCFLNSLYVYNISVDWYWGCSVHFLMC